MDYDLKNIHKYENGRTLVLFEELEKGMIVFPKRNVPDGKHYVSAREFRENGPMEVAYRGSTITFKRLDETITDHLKFGRNKVFIVHGVSEKTIKKRNFQLIQDQEAIEGREALLNFIEDELGISMKEEGLKLVVDVRSFDDYSSMISIEIKQGWNQLIGIATRNLENFIKGESFHSFLMLLRDVINEGKEIPWEKEAK